MLIADPVPAEVTDPEATNAQNPRTTATNPVIKSLGTIPPLPARSSARLEWS